MFALWIKIAAVVFAVAVAGGVALVYKRIVEPNLSAPREGGRSGPACTNEEGSTK